MSNDSKTTTTWVWENKVKGFTPKRIEKLVKKDKQSCILKIDGDYPKELLKKRNELPILSEKLKLGKVENFSLVPSLNNKKSWYTSKIELGNETWLKAEERTSDHYVWKYLLVETLHHFEYQTENRWRWCKK